MPFGGWKSYKNYKLQLQELGYRRGTARRAICRVKILSFSLRRSVYRRSELKSTELTDASEEFDAERSEDEEE